MPSISHSLLALLLLTGGIAAQGVDLAAAERELDSMFDRPAGTPISDAQKADLAAFLERHRGHDLAHLSYASALHEYFERRYDDAAAALDRFFEKQSSIANSEHATMAGRIYLNAMRVEGEEREPDLGKLALWAERMTRLYPDTGTLARHMSILLRRVEEPTRIRLALARGVLDSPASDADKEQFLITLYGGDATPKPPAKSTPRRPAEGQPGPGTDAAIPKFTALHALNGAASFDPDDLRGKVVLLDFWATWCPPCREAIPRVLELRKRFGESVATFGITRFYGRGMDFSGPDAALPHGGRAVKDLDRQAEIAVNERFVTRFGIDYPILFVDSAVMGQTFGVSLLPTILVIGPDGKIAGRITGGGAAQHRQLEELVEKTLGRVRTGR